jgi:hypothetical protein
MDSNRRLQLLECFVWKHRRRRCYSVHINGSKLLGLSDNVTAESSLTRSQGGLELFRGTGLRANRDNSNNPVADRLSGRIGAVV